MPAWLRPLDLFRTVVATPFKRQHRFLRPFQGLGSLTRHERILRRTELLPGGDHGVYKLLRINVSAVRKLPECPLANLLEFVLLFDPRELLSAKLSELRVRRVKHVADGSQMDEESLPFQMKNGSVVLCFSQADGHGFDCTVCGVASIKRLLQSVADLGIEAASALFGLILQTAAQIDRNAQRVWRLLFLFHPAIIDSF